MGTDSEQQNQELQKEWRMIVLERLSSIEQGQKELKSEIVDIKTTFVKQQTLDSLRESNHTELQQLKDKVEKLENFKLKVTGIIIGINLVLGILFRIFFDK